MGKKRSRAKQVSKGITHQNKNPLLKAQRREYRASFSRLLNQLEAHMKNKNVVLTVPNPDKNNTKERFIKVNSRDYWRTGKR